MKKLTLLLMGSILAVGVLQAQTPVEKPADPCKLDSIPKALSPNGDGKNDVFQLNSPCVLEQFSFKLFNRWGNELFSTNDQHFKWDGTDASGKLPEMGTYFYNLSYMKDGEKKDVNGFVTIVY